MSAKLNDKKLRVVAMKVKQGQEPLQERERERERGWDRADAREGGRVRICTLLDRARSLEHAGAGV